MVPRVVREVVRAPGFAIATIASLALAVGANTAIFSVVNALWLRPLPVHDAHAIVVPYYPVVHSQDGELLDHVQLPQALELRSASQFAGVTYQLAVNTRVGDWRPMVRSAAGQPPFATQAVAANYFSVLGVPIEGRAFTDEEEARGADAVAVVSRELWRRYAGTRHFSAGLSIPTTAGALAVIGVAPAGFRGTRLGDRVDIWIPAGALERFSELAAEPGIERLMPVTVLARLRDGVSIESAEDEARAYLHPRVSLRRLRDVAFPLRSEGGLLRQRSLIQTQLAAALLVLLLGATNLASLFLARAVGRRHDFAIRLSLGATRASLAASIAAEAGVLAAAGVAAGLVFRAWLLRGIAALETSSGVAVESLDTSLDWRILAYAAVTALAAMLIAASGALRQASRADLREIVAASAWGGARAQRRARQVLLATHACLAVGLLVAAVTLVSTVARAFRADAPFARRDLVAVTVRPLFAQYADGSGEARRAADYARIIDEIATLPPVRGAAEGAFPLRPFNTPEPAELIADGRAIRTPLMRLNAGAGYASALDVALVEGRDLDSADVQNAADPRAMTRYLALRRLPQFREGPPNGGRSAVIIDRTLAAVLWPGSPALGRSFTWKAYDITYTVVGVTAPLGQHPRAPEAVPVMITPSKPDLDGLNPLRLIVRTASNERPPVTPIADLLRARFPDAPLLEVRTATDVLEAELAQERMGARIFGYYAIAAVMLALLGVYGLVSFLIHASRKEFAVRYALGASERRLERMTVMRVICPVAAGAFGGALLSQLLGRALAAKVVGLGSISAAMSMAASLLFCVLAVVIGLAAWRRLRHADAALMLKSA